MGEEAGEQAAAELDMPEVPVHPVGREMEGRGWREGIECEGKRMPAAGKARRVEYLRDVQR